MRVAIRAGRGEDWEAMRDIFIQAGQAAWAHILSAETLADLSPLDRWHPRAGGNVLAVECEREVVGFVCLRASADEDAEPTTGEIDACYVLPSVWGTGVGQALLAAADWLNPASRKPLSGRNTGTIGRCGSTGLADGDLMVPSGAARIAAPSCWNSVID